MFGEIIEVKKADFIIKNNKVKQFGQLRTENGAIIPFAVKEKAINVKASEKVLFQQEATYNGIITWVIPWERAKEMKSWGSLIKGAKFWPSATSYTTLNDVESYYKSDKWKCYFTFYVEHAFYKLNKIYAKKKKSFRKWFGHDHWVFFLEIEHKEHPDLKHTLCFDQGIGTFWKNKQTGKFHLKGTFPHEERRKGNLIEIQMGNDKGRYPYTSEELRDHMIEYVKQLWELKTQNISEQYDGFEVAMNHRMRVNSHALTDYGVHVDERKEDAAHLAYTEE